MKFALVRQPDTLGRVVLPMDIRRFYGWNIEHPLCLRETADGVVLTSATAETADLCMDMLGRVVIPEPIRKRFAMQACTDLALVPCDDGLHISLLMS